MIRKVASLVLTSLLCLSVIVGQADLGWAQSPGWVTNQFNQNSMRQQQQMMEQQRRQQQQMMEQQRRQQEEMRRQQQAREQERIRQQQRQAEQQRQLQERLRRETTDRLRRIQPRNEFALRQDRQRQEQVRLRWAQDQKLRDRMVGERQDSAFRLLGQRTSLSRPPTPAEMRRGFRGRFLPDGRAIVTVRGKTFIVKASVIGVRPPLGAGVSARGNMMAEGMRSSLQSRLSGSAFSAGVSRGGYKLRELASSGSSPQRSRAGGNKGALDLMILVRSSGALVVGPTYLVNADIRGISGVEAPLHLRRLNLSHAAVVELDHRLRQQQQNASNQNNGNQLRFGDKDLVYGPTAQGALRDLANSAGGVTLFDLHLQKGNREWIEFSLDTLADAAREGRQIHFDLTYMEDIDDALGARGKWGEQKIVTGHEIRFIKSNWNEFRVKPKFYFRGAEVDPPW